MKLPTFDVRYLDVTPNLVSGNMPMYVLERPKVHDHPKAWAGHSEVACEGRFWVPQFEAFVDKQSWSFCEQGGHVLVPIHAYRTQQRALTTIFGLGQQIALAFLLSFLEDVGEAVSGVVQILGHDCTDLTAQGIDAFRCYVGVAFRAKTKV